MSPCETATLSSPLPHSDGVLADLAEHYDWLMGCSLLLQNQHHSSMGRRQHLTPSRECLHEVIEVADCACVPRPKMDNNFAVIPRICPDLNYSFDDVATECPR